MAMADEVTPRFPVTRYQRKVEHYEDDPSFRQIHDGGISFVVPARFAEHYLLLERAAAIASEEWGGSEEGHITIETNDMGVKHETCTSCGATHSFNQVGMRPFKHRDNCRKVRWDALFPSQPPLD